MLTSNDTPVKSTVCPPWRRGSENLKGKSFCAQAPEFVPSWEREAEPDVTRVARKPWRAAAAEFIPRSLAADKDTDNDVLISAKSECVDSAEETHLHTKRPPSGDGKAVAGEAVELCHSSQGNASDSAKEAGFAKPTHWQAKAAKGAKPSPWKRDLADSSEEAVNAEDFPSLTAAPIKASKKGSPGKADAISTVDAVASSATLSTTEGSPRGENSIDNDLSDSLPSCNSEAWSQVPVPASPRKAQEEVSHVDLRALLQWRFVTTPERPQDLLTSTTEPEAGTPEAAVCTYVQEAAATTIASAVVAESLAHVPERREDPSSGRRAEEDITPLWRRSEADTTSSWRRTGDSLPTAPLQDERCWRNVEPVKKLEISGDSWAAQQRARRSKQQSSESEEASDNELLRSMKSLLNKLTVEKFDSISTQLLDCGIQKATHLEMLIREVFEKATTQHHFIDMYADLCTLLAQHNCIDDAKAVKKVLLNCCQASFEKNLTPPAGIEKLVAEDRTSEELKYKMSMLGNIRFVGALFVRKMLASKVMLAIMEELLQDPTPEALESLAAFLTVVGPTFDTPDWAYRATLNAVFIQVEKLSKKKSVPKRVRCLLKDVLDLRAETWQNRRPKKIEGPLKLQEVAAKAAAENDHSWEAQKPPSSGDDWETVGAGRQVKLVSPFSSSPASPCSQEKVEKAIKLFMKAKDNEQATKPVAQSMQSEIFDEEACRAEISATLGELRVSHDVPDAVARIAGIAVPALHQPLELVDILSRLAEDGSQTGRKLGFDLIVQLFQQSHWVPASARKGLRIFVEETCEDLKYDVPTLSQILRDELHPALTPLVQRKFIDQEQHNALCTV